MMRLRTYLVRSQLVGVFLPIIFLGIVVFYFISNLIHTEITTRNTMVAHSISHHIVEMLEEPVQRMKLIRELYIEQRSSNDEEVERLVEKIVDSDRFIEHVEVLDAGGIVVKTLPEQPDVQGIDHSNQPFFTAIKAGAPIYWSDSFVSLATGRPTIIIAMPAQDKVLIGYLDLDQINLLAQSFSNSYGEEVFVAVTDAKGVLLTHFDQSRVTQRQKSAVFSDLKDLESAQQKEYTAMISGRRYLASMVLLEHPQWGVIVCQAYDASFSVLHRIQFFFVIVAGLSFLMIFRYLRKNINDLVFDFTTLNERFFEIASGNFQTRVGQGKYSELNEMANSFNAMVDSVRARDESLQKLACIDMLTGLANRASFMKQLEEAVENETRPFAVAFFDLDNFKVINDAHGHWCGDEVLQIIANRLKEVSSEDVCFARFGGDEFVLLKKNWQAEQDIQWLGQLRALMTQPICVENYVFYVEVSVGVSVFPHDSTEADELLKYADLAMYQVKYGGKNGCRFYDAAMLAKLRRKIELADSMKNPHLFDELALHYQPLVDADKPRIRGFEALIRWQSGKVGFVSPAEFIPLAEETGMIVGIGIWVLRTALAKLVEINLAFNSPHFVMSVNVSAVQLKTPGFADVVMQTMEEYGISPAQLELEITESVVIDSFDDVIGVCGKLREYGVKIALDDFGTGYSSLSYLHNLPIDTIKIDRSLMVDVAHSSRAQHMLTGIAFLSKKLGLNVVAEGIETKEQADLLEQMGIDFAQGYYFQKPLAEQALDEYCSKIFVGEE